MTIPNPDLQWYISQSRAMRLSSPRCPLASCELCPRFYESVVLLGKAGELHPLAPEEQARLDRTWPVVASRVVEEDVRVVWDAKHLIAGYELCPEVSALAFGYFVSGLHAYADNIDLGCAQEMLSQRKIPFEDFRWAWSGVTPRHYSACREYSILAGGVSGQRMKTPRARRAVPQKQRSRILRRDNCTCQYCGAKAPAAQLEVDHIISVNDGGTNDDDNLKTACIDCNQGKGQESYR